MSTSFFNNFQPGGVHSRLSCFHAQENESRLIAAALNDDVDHDSVESHDESTLTFQLEEAHSGNPNQKSFIFRRASSFHPTQRASGICSSNKLSQLQRVPASKERHFVKPTISLPLIKMESESTFRSSNPSQGVGVTKSPLKSVLKHTQCIKENKPRHHKKLGVHGLWNENSSDPFTRMHDKLLLDIFSYNTVTERCRLSMVSRRWNFVANLDTLWKSVDASRMVQDLYKYYFKIDPMTAAAATSLALELRLNRHVIEKLCIQSIGDCMVANKFFLSSGSLQELTLTAFHDLTDTHVHVILLGVSDGKARMKRTSTLRKLSLEDCPLLTNAVVRSIVSLCPNLEELSLRGCASISDIAPLRGRQKLRVSHSLPSCKEVHSAETFDPAARQTSLASLFASPEALGNALKHSPRPTAFALFPAPPPSLTASAGIGALSSLFEQPPLSQEPRLACRDPRQEQRAR